MLTSLDESEHDSLCSFLHEIVKTVRFCCNCLLLVTIFTGCKQLCIKFFIVDLLLHAYFLHFWSSHNIIAIYSYRSLCMADQSRSLQSYFLPLYRIAQFYCMSKKLERYFFQVICDYNFQKYSKLVLLSLHCFLHKTIVAIQTKAIMEYI